ncbi:MAG: DUF1566 domain-containing protein [bacterium]
MKRKKKLHLPKATLPLIVAETAAAQITVPFRSLALNELTVVDWDTMLAEKLWFEKLWSKHGAFLQRGYKTVGRKHEKLVIDRATELTWQQSGSSDAVTYDDAEKYIHELNKQKFAGYKDWRLPTLDEAMSLLKPHKSGNDLFIEPAFDQTQKWIWTLDESDAGVPWVVTFRAGCCYVPSESQYYVRAVRGEFWFPGNESLAEDALLELIF